MARLCAAVEQLAFRRMQKKEKEAAAAAAGMTKAQRMKYNLDKKKQAKALAAASAPPGWIGPPPDGATWVEKYDESSQRACVAPRCRCRHTVAASGAAIAEGRG